MKLSTNNWGYFLFNFKTYLCLISWKCIFINIIDTQGFFKNHVSTHATLVFSYA